MTFYGNRSLKCFSANCAARFGHFSTRALGAVEAIKKLGGQTINSKAVLLEIYEIVQSPKN